MSAIEASAGESRLSRPSDSAPKKGTPRFRRSELLPLISKSAFFLACSLVGRISAESIGEIVTMPSAAAIEAGIPGKA